MSIKQRLLDKIKELRAIASELTEDQFAHIELPLEELEDNTSNCLEN